MLHAEELGYRSLFVVEHHFTGNSQVSASLNLLSFLAGRTSRMRLGTAVVVLPWHNPVLLAEQVATLDLLSNGRFDFGVGKGYRDSEFESFCIPKAEATERFDECIAIMRQRLDQRGPLHATRASTGISATSWSSRARCSARIRRSGWAPAASRGSSAPAATATTFCSTRSRRSSSPSSASARYRAALEAQGQRYDGMRVGVTRAVRIVATEDERREAFALRRRTLSAIGALARGPGAERYQNAASFADADLASENAALIGTPDEIIAQLRQLQAGGVDYVLLIDSGGSKDTLRVFADEVMPEFATRRSQARAIGATPIRSSPRKRSKNCSVHRPVALGPASAGTSGDSVSEPAPPEFRRGRARSSGMPNYFGHHGP